MSNPTLPPAAPVVPPMGGEDAISSPPLRRRARDPDDDHEDALEESEQRVLVHESASDTEDDDDDEARRYLLKRRVEYEVEYDPEVFRRLPQRRRPLNAVDIFRLGPGVGDALPSPTPSSECDSEGTLSDDHHGYGGGNPTGSTGSSAAWTSSAAPTAAADAVGRGWAATGKRGWKAGGNNNKKPAAVVLVNTVSAGGNGQAGTTSSSAQASLAAHHHQPPPLPEQGPQPRRAPPRRRERERATEYTCKECGKSYTTSQALGGHAAGHKNKQREAAAMAAAAAAAAGGGVDGSGGASSLAAAFPFPLLPGGGKADKPHECRECGKVFALGMSLGGHMRAHYTGTPIVPVRKNKKRCLAPMPPAVGRSLALSIKTEEEPPSTPPPAVPAGGAVRVVRLFGIDISPPQVQAPLQQQGSGGTSTEDSSSPGQEQH